MHDHAEERRLADARPRFEEPRGEEMVEPEGVAAMLRLKEAGWGTKRIAAELDLNRGTVKRYLRAGGWQPFKAPERSKLLAGLEDWLRERFRRHRGNADVVRQELLSEKGIAASLRTVQRAVEPYRQELEAEARASVRFETAAGRQLQIDFGERLVEIGGRKIKVFLFVAVLGYSRRLHVRAFLNERQESWFAGLESAFLTFGGVPEEVLMDNARALVLAHDTQTRAVTFTPKLLAFARHWGFKPKACAPCRPPGLRSGISPTPFARKCSKPSWWISPNRRAQAQTSASCCNSITPDGMGRKICKSPTASKRCVELIGQQDIIRASTLFHWWPEPTSVKITHERRPIMATKYYGFGGFLDNDEPLGLMRRFDGKRTPETLHQQKGWVRQDHLRTYVNSGEAWRQG